MENKCGFCGKKTLSLRRCSACQHVYYCTTVCQREDWRGQHKVKCNEIQNRKQTERTNASEDANYIPVSGSGTGKPLYPPESSHGISHEKFGEMMRKQGMTRHFAMDNLSNSILSFDDLNKQSNTEGTGSTLYLKCQVCGKAGDTVKTCARCKMVAYCSKQCQRQDWKTHKRQCENPEVHGSIKTDGYRREETHASGSARSTGRGVFHGDLPTPKAPDLSHRSYVEPGALDRAKSLTWKTFPGCTILDFVREIPHEMFGKRPGNTSLVAVGFISRYHSYVLRHCIYLQDKDGDEVYVGFYLERNEPRPYFRWDDVVPGRYLCIKDPYIHQFLDGSVGIRVGDASTARAFSI